MAFPPAGTVPTTDARASVEIESPAVDAVDPADVDSGADIARRASGLAAVDTRAVTEAELERALDGNATAIAALETYYRDPVVAADRLGELSPAERDELRAGNLEVLGETRTAPNTDGLGRDEVGAGLAAYSQNRNDYALAYDAAETREMDRATGREPDMEREPSPSTDLEPGRDPGQAPSRGGLGGFMEGMRNAEQSAGSGGGRAERSPEEMLTQQTVAMRPNL